MIFTTRFMRLLAAAIMLIAFLAACGGDDDTGGETASEEPAQEPARDQAADEPADDSGAVATDSAGEDSAEEAAEEPAEEPSDDSAEPAQDSGGEADGLAVPTALTPADIGRDIIFRATISVEVDDVSAAGREAQALVQGLGGIVFGQETVTEPEPRTVLTFKVFPEDFSRALEELAALGDLVNQQVSADDVTERIVDLESRINTAAASVERLRALIVDAGAVDIIAQLENQLLERETTLEQLRGQLRTIQDQVDLATIVLTITPSPRVVPRAGVGITGWLSEGEDDPCLGQPELTVEPDANVHLCLEIENTGESSLTDLEIDSPELRLRLDQLTVVEGSIDELAAGDRLVVTTSETLSDGRIAGRIATRGLNLVANVTATPIDEQGNRLAQVSDETSVHLTAEEEDSLPGFVDALGAGIGAIAFVGSLVLVAIAVTLPFVPIVAVLALVVTWSRRRRETTTVGPSVASAPTDEAGTTTEPDPEPAAR